jgi:tetratricopeptide (TPR) repeat protein
MFDSFKKLLGKSKPDEIEDPAITENLAKKSEKFQQFLNESFSSIKNEILAAKEKMKDLHQANFDLGNRHLENGNLSEAIFRFRFIKKFWPDDYDAYYQLAYCLILKEKPKKARRVLEELLEKNPNYDPVAQELLDRLNGVIGD